MTLNQAKWQVIDKKKKTEDKPTHKKVVKTTKETVEEIKQFGRH